MPPTIPKEEDFAGLGSSLTLSLHFPDPPESTTAILLLFHGLGDNHLPFATFATNVSLPGTLAISVRAPHPVPSFLVDAPPPAGTGDRGHLHFHWGDDVSVDSRTGDLDPDPGFDKAARLVLGDLVQGVLVNRCGWGPRDVLLFGFGQGGSLALGLAARIASPLASGWVGTVVEADDDGREEKEGTRNSRGGGHRGGGGDDTFKGVVSVGGALPRSMVSTVGGRSKAKTRVLLVQVDEDAVDHVGREFESVETVRWRRSGVDMPHDRDEFYPIMSFFARRLAPEGGLFGAP